MAKLRSRVRQSRPDASGRKSSCLGIRGRRDPSADRYSDIQQRLAVLGKAPISWPRDVVAIGGAEAPEAQGTALLSVFLSESRSGFEQRSFAIAFLEIMGLPQPWEMGATPSRGDHDLRESLAVETRRERRATAEPFSFGA